MAFGGVSLSKEGGDVIRINRCKKAQMRQTVELAFRLFPLQAKGQVAVADDHDGDAENDAGGNRNADRCLKEPRKSGFELGCGTDLHAVVRPNIVVPRVGELLQHIALELVFIQQLEADDFLHRDVVLRAKREAVPDGGICKGAQVGNAVCCVHAQPVVGSTVIRAHPEHGFVLIFDASGGERHGHRFEAAGMRENSPRGPANEQNDDGFDAVSDAFGEFHGRKVIDGIQVLMSD